MKVYENTEVTLAYQNCGSTWLGILKGIAEDINLVFNGLYNLKGTNGELTFENEEKTVATFWTSEEKMHEFFFTRKWLFLDFHQETEENIQACQDYADAQMVELKQHSTQFRSFQKEFLTDEYSVGKVSAERPDSDFKDAVLQHAFN